VPRQTKRVLTDAHWAAIRPHIPEYVPSGKGGRPRADDRDCLEGLLWLLRTGARWQDAPVDLPSGSTLWRRAREWADAGVLGAVHAALVERLGADGKLALSELFADATFVRAKRGVRTSA
jgi:transposase